MYIKTVGIEVLRLVLRVPLSLRWLPCSVYSRMARLINPHRNR
jgi:hypothetical protein